MGPERWQEIKKLYHAVLQREEVTRATFLEEACAGDEELHREVESLLDHERRGQRMPLNLAINDVPPKSD